MEDISFLKKAKGTAGEGREKPKDSKNKIWNKETK